MLEVSCQIYILERLFYKLVQIIAKSCNQIIVPTRTSW